MKKYLGLLTGLLPLMTSAQLVMTGHYYVVLDGGSSSSPTTLVLTNSAPSGITNTGSGWIVSENEFNLVDWNIGTNTGTYVVPFGYSNSDYLPVTCDITTAGTGNGSIKFSTYHTTALNTPPPSDVTTMSDFGAANYSNNAVDRFWILEADNYTTKPTPNITFTYINRGAESETATPNYIVDSTLIAQRFNSTSDEWSDWLGTINTNVTSTNTGTVTSGNVPPSDFYRSWALFNDSTLVPPTGIPSVNGTPAMIEVFPNPSLGNFTITGVAQGQTIELYDYLGQKLSSAMADDNSTMHFDISTKANGVYLVRILNRDGSLDTQKKIVKTQ